MLLVVPKKISGLGRPALRFVMNLVRAQGKRRIIRCWRWVCGFRLNFCIKTIT